MGILEATSAAASLMTIALRATESAQRISTIIAAAQAEGRDLTDAEIADIREMRDRAMARWNG